MCFMLTGKTVILHHHQQHQHTGCGSAPGSTGSDLASNIHSGKEVRNPDLFLEIIRIITIIIIKLLLLHEEASTHAF